MTGTRLLLRSRSVRLVVLLVLLVLQGVSYMLLAPQLGQEAVIPYLLVVIAAGWLLGLWGGLLAGLATFPLHTVWLNLAGLLLGRPDFVGWDAATRPGIMPGPVVPGTFVLTVVGLGIGRLRDLQRRAGMELAERKQAEAALQESEQRYQALFEQAPLGLVRVTLDGRIQ
ncbi:MAG: hypothetical protein CL878_08845 [Dehalococcoidia bacterium]|nr:hypothetical protein [Dehalococcoidia bacterium]